MTIAIQQALWWLHFSKGRRQRYPAFWHHDSCLAHLEQLSCTLQKRKNEFTSKTDTGSAELYFHYYGMLMHQQNMLQDQIRTGTYYAAILENAADFQGKVVMDVGAGSGVLSLFAAQVPSFLKAFHSAAYDLHCPHN